MATTSRLGIDIIGRDKTRAAFASVQRSLNSLQKFAAVGLGGYFGGNALRGIINSLIAINRHTKPVGTAINEMQRAWQAFALQVGAAGLNEGLINFSRRMGALLIGTDGLSQSIGRFLGSGVRILGQIFEGIGRAIAFAYDNGQIFIRVFAAMAAMNIAIRIVAAARAFVMLITALKAASLASALFHLVSRRALVVWAGAAAIFASATGTLDELQQAMGWVWQQAEQLIPAIDGGVAAALQRMGFDVTSLTADLGAFESKLADLPALFGDVAKSAGKAVKPVADAIKKLTTSQQLAVDLGDSFRGWSQDILRGEKAIDALKSALERLQSTLLDRAFDMLLPSATGGPGGGYGQGGLLSLLSSFGGFFAAGGNLGAGKWGVAGENGPEIVRGPASIIPMGGGGPSIKIINNNGSQVTPRSSGWGDRRDLEFIIDNRQASNNANPYSNASRTLSARGAGPGVKKR